MVVDKGKHGTTAPKMYLDKSAAASDVNPATFLDVDIWFNLGCDVA